jgi:hypothetical protein
VNERDTAPALGSPRPIAPPAMLPSAISSTSLLLRSSRRRRTAPAYQQLHAQRRQHGQLELPDQLELAAIRAALVMLQRRRATEQKPISTASAAAWWARWTCTPARSATRHPDRSAPPTRSIYTYHRRFLQLSIIGRVLCVQCVRRPLARFSPRIRAVVFATSFCYVRTTCDSLLLRGSRFALFEVWHACSLKA